MSGGFREEGFAALLTIITETNKQRIWLGFVTPNFTTATVIYARLFRMVFSDEMQWPAFAGSADVPSALSVPARILKGAKDSGRDGRASSKNKNAA